MKSKIFLSIATALMFILTSAAMAAIPQISQNKYIKMYGLSVQNDLPVFTNQNLNQRGTSNPAQAYAATIYANDEIYVYQMTGRWSLISYPVKNGRRYGYVRTSDLTSNNFSQNQKRCTAYIGTVYARPGVRYPGSSISNGDPVWTVARQGNYTQVVYPAGNLYKMAWVTSNDYNQYIGGNGRSTGGGNVTNIKGDVNNDGKVDETDINLIKSYIVGNVGDSSINKNNADFNNDGQINILDMSAILVSIKNNTNTTSVSSSSTPNDNVTTPMKNWYCTWRSHKNWSWGDYNYNSSHPERSWHLGLDVYGDNGYVYSMADGTVVSCSNSNNGGGANGRYIVIKHENIGGRSCYSFYAHLSSIKVSVNQQVHAGEHIAIAGGSGYGKDTYYGTHLHFAIVDQFSAGKYYGYATQFSGDKVNYGGVTFYNPRYVLQHKRLP